MADFGKLNFSVSFNRTSAFPLEANSYFNNYTEAELAALTAVEPGSADSAYYIGLTLTVADETDCDLYIIKPDLSLKRLTNQDTSDIAWESILNKPTTISGYGITDAYTKTEADKKFVDVSGDTMTGPLIVVGKSTSAFNTPGIIFGDNSGRIGTSGDNSLGIFAGNNITLRPGSLDASSGKGLYVSTTAITYNDNKVWHAGNMGSDSGLNADLLDGRDYHQFLYNFSQNYGSSDDIRNILPWTYFSGNNMINSPTSLWFSGIVMAANNNPNYKAILGFDATGNLYATSNNNNSWRAWLQVAYITSNVASATKLQTPRYLWGNSFDGTSNVSGRMIVNSSINAIGNYDEGIRINAHSNNWTSLVLCGIDNTLDYGTSKKTWVFGNHDGNLYINRNGANLHTGYELCNVNGNWGIGTNFPSQKLHVSGNILATGFYEESDIQLKTNIQPIDFTNNIELVSFNWKKDGSKSYGVIAQQVELYYPELVSTDESTGYKSVNYDAVLIIKCALLENRIKQLEKELEDLKNE